MTAKEYLHEIKKADIAIDQKQVEFDTLKRSRTYIGGMDYSEDRVQTSPNSSGFTNISDKLMDMQNEINIEIDRWHDIRHKKISQIQQLSKVEYTEVLFKKYVEYKSLEQISCEMGFVYNYTCNLHGQALKEFHKKFLTILK